MKWTILYKDAQLSHENKMFHRWMSRECDLIVCAKDTELNKHMQKSSTLP